MTLPIFKTQGRQSRTLLDAAFTSERPTFRKAIGFSMVTSILILAPTVFMLEVYDRVVNSRSSITLLSLLVCLIGIYVLMGLLEIIRNRLLSQAAWHIDMALREQIHDATFLNSLRQGATSAQPFRDLRTLREFISSSATTAMMDLPSSLLFLLLIFIINPWLGVAAMLGALIQASIGVNTEHKTMPALTEANQAAIVAQNYAGNALRNAQVMSAMGMKNRIHDRWISRQRKFLALQAIASDVASSNSAMSKFTQTMQSSLILGLAGWMALKGTLLGGGGMMIVASTLGGRVLSPMVVLVSHWRMVVNARDSYHRLEQFLGTVPPEIERMSLPAPQGQLSVKNVIAVAPGSNQAILKGVSFHLQPGDTLMIIGPSAAGKTTLARLLMGIWPTSSGEIRLDGADIHAWNKNELGPHLGYLPQNVELFAGTLAENIARFGKVEIDKVRAATQLAGLDAIIEALPNGLDSQIGEEGSLLSGGQRQRVGLARAIYGNPSFVLLDEPNSNLDKLGEQALLNTLMSLKSDKCTTIVITHRTNVLPAADKILILRDGQVAAFGPRDEVLAALSQANVKQPPFVKNHIGQTIKDTQ